MLKTKEETEAEKKAWLESEEYQKMKERHARALKEANSMKVDPNACKRSQDHEWGMRYARIMLEQTVPGVLTLVLYCFY